MYHMFFSATLRIFSCWLLWSSRVRWITSEEEPGLYTLKSRPKRARPSIDYKWKLYYREKANHFFGDLGFGFIVNYEGLAFEPWFGKSWFTSRWTTSLDMTIFLTYDSHLGFIIRHMLLSRESTGAAYGQAGQLVKFCTHLKRVF